MRFDELKDELRSMGKPGRELLALATIGGAVRQEYAAHAEAATSARAFLDAVYADDDLRFTALWSAWAKADRKDWLVRFAPERCVRGVELVRRGLPVEFAGGGALLIPAEARGGRATVAEFADGAINAEAAEFLMAVEGAFACGGLVFDGTYDVLRDRGTVIFVRWRLNARGQRASAAELAERFCKTG